MKIHISPIPASILSEIFIYTEPGANPGDIGSFLEFKDGEVVATRLVSGTGSYDDIKPAFTIDERTLRDLIAAFAELAQSRGIENKSETFTKGKLEATERHLADMRQLVFKPTD